MIDLLSKKKVLLAFGLILIICFSTYIIKAHWAYTRQLANQENAMRSKAKASISCKTHSTITGCQKCSRDELRNLISYCMETGFKEEVQCDDGRTEFIWCDISPAVEEYAFWRFEVVCLLFGLSSYTVVFLRQRKLDKILLEKFHKQISSGL